MSALLAAIGGCLDTFEVDGFQGVAWVLHGYLPYLTYLSR